MMTRQLHHVPFDKDRDGFVIGEGSGVVIFEDGTCPERVQRSMLRLQVPVYQEMLSHDTTSSRRLRRVLAMRAALEDAE